MVKRTNVWVPRESAKLAREILGANGIVDDFPVIRHMLNIESVYTYEGTHDIHGLIIGDAVPGIAAYNAPRPSEREAPAQAVTTETRREPWRGCSSRTSSASRSRRRGARAPPR